MLIKQYQTGPFDVNTYALIDESTKKVALIDVGGSIKEIVEDLKKDNFQVKYILNTHGHFDHIYGEFEAQMLYNLPVYIHKNDLLMVEKLGEQLQMWGGFDEVEPPKITDFLYDNQILKLGNLEIKVLHTPGHTTGGIGLLCENTLFSGDSLFQQSIGRTDLPFGSFEDLVNSVKEKFMSLPDNTRVLPGHGDETTIGYEKKYNEYIK